LSVGGWEKKKSTEKKNAPCLIKREVTEFTLSPVLCIVEKRKRGQKKKSLGNKKTNSVPEKKETPP